MEKVNFKRWSPFEKEQLINGLENGKTINELSTSLNRSYKSISNFKYRLRNKNEVSTRFKIKRITSKNENFTESNTTNQLELKKDSLFFTISRFFSLDSFLNLFK
jgi:hypothetical protein